MCVAELVKVSGQESHASGHQSWLSALLWRRWRNVRWSWHGIGQYPGRDAWNRTPRRAMDCFNLPSPPSFIFKPALDGPGLHDPCGRAHPGRSIDEIDAKPYALLHEGLHLVELVPVLVIRAEDSVPDRLAELGNRAHIPVAALVPLHGRALVLALPEQAYQDRRVLNKPSHDRVVVRDPPLKALLERKLERPRHALDLLDSLFANPIRLALVDRAVLEDCLVLSRSLDALLQRNHRRFLVSLKNNLLVPEVLEVLEHCAVDVVAVQLILGALALHHVGECHARIVVPQHEDGTGLLLVDVAHEAEVT